MPAREADACAPFAPFANLRTKNRSHWQVFTFRGRRSWRRSRCRSACFPLCLVTALGCCAALLRALVWSAQATSNRQNLPAGAVFRAQAPLWGQGREVGAARERETGVWRRGMRSGDARTGEAKRGAATGRRCGGSKRRRPRLPRHRAPLRSERRSAACRVAPKEGLSLFVIYAILCSSTLVQ